MAVYDEDGVPIEDDKAAKITQGVQTNPIWSLPCNECISKEVALHPLVAQGRVDLELARAVITPLGTMEATKKRKLKRECSTSRWLTEKSEIKRRRESEQKKQEGKEEKERWVKARQINKVLKDEERKAKKAQRQVERKEKEMLRKSLVEQNKKHQEEKRARARELKAACGATKIGQISKKGFCNVCHK